MQRIRKVIIPAAGSGTRLLPATKAQPKEMLPIIDTPVIQHVVEEAVASGITDVIIVTGSNKRAIEDHFDDQPELENWLTKQGKIAARNQIRRISRLANFVYIRQKGPYGNGTAVLNCRDLIGDEPFAVLFADDVFVANPPRLQQLIDVYETYGGPVLTAIKTNAEGTKKYGIIEGKKIGDRVMSVQSLLEKPGPDKAPSLWASVSGYVLTPDIFPILAQTKRGKGGEVWLTDALQVLASRRAMYAAMVDATYYDMGSKLGFLKANIEFALRRPELKGELRRYLKTITR